VVLEESFSSPNDNPTVESIKARAAAESYQVRLSDGSSFFIPPEALSDLGLHKSRTVDSTLYQRLRDAAQLFAAGQKALELAARREHSRFELRLKLQKRGFEETTIEKVIAKLERLEIIDDRRFAEAWLRSRMRRKSEGRRKLKAGLNAKGVDHRIVDELLDQSWAREKIREALEAAEDKLLEKCGGDQKKYIRMLMNRGFSWEEIRKSSFDKFYYYYEK